MLDKKEFERIKDLTVNNSYKRLKTEYLDWKQWSRPGILTSTGISIIDKENPNKHYVWVVLNLIDDITGTMKNLINWESEKVLDTDNEKTNNFLYSLNLNNIYNELVLEILKNWHWYLFLHRDSDNNYSFSVLGSQNVLVETNESNKITKAYIIKKEKKSDFQHDYYISEYTNTSKKHYKNQELVEETEWDFIIPIFQFWSWEEFLTSSILHYQDIINTKLTKAFDVEKYNTDPITVIKWINSSSGKNNTIDLWAWGVVLLPSDSSSVEKLQWLNVTREFIDLLKEAKYDFYRIAKLWALKNEDLSWVTSWYWLRLKLIDTLWYVENFRTTLKYNFRNMFKDLFNYYENPIFNVTEINFAPLIWDKLLEDEAEQKKIDVIKTKSDIIKTLTDAGYTEEQITQFLKDNEL